MIYARSSVTACKHHFQDQQRPEIAGSNKGKQLKLLEHEKVMKNELKYCFQLLALKVEQLYILGDSDKRQK